MGSPDAGGGARRVYRDMDEWTEIRYKVLRLGVSKREILRQTGLHWKTLEKILAHPAPPAFGRRSWPKPKIGPYLERIQEILESDRNVPSKKQRHTAKRIFEVLRGEGYDGGYTAVKDAVRGFKEHLKEVFVPLSHRPGEAQMDFGQALVKWNGALRKVMFFVMALPYSDAVFVRAYERECTETFQDGHVHAFAFFGGVPRRIAYDNAKTSVAQILGTYARKLTQGFLELKSHYLFDHHFCRVARGNEKGVVEGMVKFARLNFFVPVPEVRSLEELNAHLLERCQEDLRRKLRGKTRSKAELLKEDQAAFLPLPAAPFDACRKVSTTVNSLSLVRFDTNDYSVPTSYAHRPVVVKGYVDKVCIYRGDEIVATHPRLWTREEVVFNPVHYLALLERKPGAFDYARPLEEWNLPECFAVLRKRLAIEFGHRGDREFIAVLRLMEKHPLPRLQRAVQKGLAIHGHTRDAIAQFLYASETAPPPTFRLDGREHLQGVRVDAPNLRAYAALYSAGPA